MKIYYEFSRTIHVRGHEFAKVGQEQGAHAGMEAAGLLAADSQQPVRAVWAKWYQGD